MAQIVVTNISHIFLLQHDREVLRHLIRCDEISERIDADHVEVFRTVVAAEHLPVFLLTLPMFEQDGFNLGDQRERSAGGLILHFVADPSEDVVFVEPLEQGLEFQKPSMRPCFPKRKQLIANTGRRGMK